MAQPKKPAAPRKPAAARKPAAKKPAAPRAAAKPAAKSAAKSATDKVREAVTDRIVDPVRQAGVTIRASASHAAETGSNVSMKMIDHAEQNVREAFNAMRAAARSKDVTEVMKVQGDYLREQGARSMSQAREIGDLIVSFGKNAIGSLKGK